MIFPVEERGSIKYLGNEKNNEIHNLKNEIAGCKIMEIFEARKAVGFSPDSPDEAARNGYDGKCVYCIGKF